MFDYLVRATLSGAFLYSPFVPLVWLSLMSAVIFRVSSRKPFHDKELLVVAPVIFTMGIIAYGTYFAAPSRPREFPSHLWCIPATLLVQLLLSGFMVWALKGIRSSVACILFVELHMSCIAGLEATMSVSGRWL